MLGLFFFIYAVIGMNLWGAVKHGQYLTRQANFQHVGMALLTLFRMITGTHGCSSVKQRQRNALEHMFLWWSLCGVGLNIIARHCAG